MELDVVGWLAVGLAVGWVGRAAVPGGRHLWTPIGLILGAGGAVAGGSLYAAAIGYPVSMPPGGVARAVPELLLTVGGAMAALWAFALATGQLEVIQHSPADASPKHRHHGGLYGH